MCSVKSQAPQRDLAGRAALTSVYPILLQSASRQPKLLAMTEAKQDKMEDNGKEPQGEERIWWELVSADEASSSGKELALLGKILVADLITSRQYLKPCKSELQLYYPSRRWIHPRVGPAHEGLGSSKWSNLAVIRQAREHRGWGAGEPQWPTPTKILHKEWHYNVFHPSWKWG